MPIAKLHNKLHLLTPQQGNRTFLTNGESRNMEMP